MSIVRRFASGLVLVISAACLLAQHPVADGGGKKELRSYYLTITAHAGDSALTACANGFHMASLWEILDPSNLRYETALGRAEDDSGGGPPANAQGWVRTGFPASADGAVPGTANCSAWTSSLPGEFGTTVLLNSAWNDPPPAAMGPWLAVRHLCNDPRWVWCVEDE